MQDLVRCRKTFLAWWVSKPDKAIWDMACTHFRCNFLLSLPSSSSFYAPPLSILKLLQYFPAMNSFVVIVLWRGLIGCLCWICHKWQKSCGVENAVIVLCSHAPDLKGGVVRHFRLEKSKPKIKYRKRDGKNKLFKKQTSLSGSIWNLNCLIKQIQDLSKIFILKLRQIYGEIIMFRMLDSPSLNKMK